jgi:ribosomal protein L19
MITSENLQQRDVTFKPGDTVRVHYRVIEGNRERIQVFEGLVIARKGGGVNGPSRYERTRSVSPWRGSSPSIRPR